MNKKVKCIETGIIYNSIKDASLITGANSKDIGKAASHYVRPGDGRLIDKAGGYHWEFVEEKELTEEQAYINNIVTKLKKINLSYGQSSIKNALINVIYYIDEIENFESIDEIETLLNDIVIKEYNEKDGIIIDVYNCVRYIKNNFQ
jgi:hypothetical protein